MLALRLRGVVVMARVLVCHTLLWLVVVLTLLVLVHGTRRADTDSAPARSMIAEEVDVHDHVHARSSRSHAQAHHHAHARHHQPHHKEHERSHHSRLHTSPSSSLCSNISTCIEIGFNTTSPQPCGWCWDTNMAMAGNASGPLAGGGGATCTDWSYDPDSCVLHIDCAKLPTCDNILGTNTCGWCETTQVGMHGTASGPSNGTCDDWVFNAQFCASNNVPQQVHLSYSPDPTVMYVTWASSLLSDSVAYYYDADVSPAVWYKAIGNTTNFVQNNELGYKYIHRVNMTSLVPGHNYVYYVANAGLRSAANYTFRAMPSDNAFPARFVVFGDMGRYGGEPSLQALINEVHGGGNGGNGGNGGVTHQLTKESTVPSEVVQQFNDIPVTAMLHMGDFAYDMLTDLGITGDGFFQRIEPISAYVPYLTCPGNHEIEWDNSFAHYRNRFTTPNSWTDDGWRMWWSVDVQLVHLVSYSTEVLFEDPQKLASAQLDWLRDDLKRANANRTERPWIVAFGHRPMYCSNNDGDDCTTDQSVTRLALEQLFYEMGVDLILEAHEHSYERLWPVYNLTVTQENYINPRAPVHLVTGQAGCNEDDGVCINTIPGPRGAWSAFRQANTVSYGYGHLVPVNATHMYWDQVMVELDNQLLDAIWIVQDSHGPFASAASTASDAFARDNREEAVAVLVVA